MNKNFGRYILLLFLPLLIVGFTAYYFGTQPEEKLLENKDIVKESNGIIDFTLPDVEGNRYTLADYLGNKPVVLAFYASWCATCQVHAPKLSLMAENYSSNLTVIGIDSKESGENVKKFISKNNLTHIVLVDKEGVVAMNYGVGYNSFYVLLNKDGTVYRKLSGSITEKDIVDLIDRNEVNLNSI